jgi:hypothetical protein
VSVDEPDPSDRWFDLAVLDDTSVDRILHGQDPALAPLGYVDVAKVMCAASAPARPEELRAEARVLAGYREAMSHAERRPRWWAILSRLRQPRVAAAVVAVGLVIDGGLAAAGTGSLPAPAQRIAAEVLGLAGIKVPDPRGPSRVPSPSSAPWPATTNGPGPDPVGSPAGASSSSTVPGLPQHGPARPSAPAVTTQPAIGPTQRSGGAAGPGSSPNSNGNGNGNARGHVSSSTGPPGQTGSNGNGNGKAEGHVNSSTGPPGPTGSNGNGIGNGNAWGRANNSARLPGQNSNGNGKSNGHDNG